MQVVFQFSKLASLESLLNMQMLERQNAVWWKEYEEYIRILCKEEVVKPRARSNIYITG